MSNGDYGHTLKFASISQQLYYKLCIVDLINEFSAKKDTQHDSLSLCLSMIDHRSLSTQRISFSQFLLATFFVCYWFSYWSVNSISRFLFVCIFIAVAELKKNETTTNVNIMSTKLITNDVMHWLVTNVPNGRVHFDNWLHFSIIIANENFRSFHSIFDVISHTLS